MKPDGLSWGLFGVNLVNTRSNLLGAGDVLDAAALDKYSFVRNAYLQRHQMLISNARGEAAATSSNDALPKYDLPEDGAAPAAAGAAGAAAQRRWRCNGAGRRIGRGGGRSGFGHGRIAEPGQRDERAGDAGGAAVAGRVPVPEHPAALTDLHSLQPETIQSVAYANARKLPAPTFASTHSCRPL